MQNVVNRMGWVLAGVVSLVALAAITGIVHGGPLDPPGAPAPTLPQAEKRSPIPPVGWNLSFPIVINSPGSYYLTQAVSDFFGSTDAIDIQSDDVTLDLNGF